MAVGFGSPPERERRGRGGTQRKPLQADHFSPLSIQIKAKGRGYTECTLLSLGKHPSVISATTSASLCISKDSAIETQLGPAPEGKNSAQA